MAAGVGLVQGLCEEATCPICLDYFKDPVMIPECGHNLCKSCLDQYCGLGTRSTTCPQCRRTFQRGSVGPNRQLANMVEIARKLSLRGAEGKEKVCEMHQKPKHLFCKDDKILICVTCEHKDHRGHQTLLVEEAGQECRSQILNRLETLREEKKKMLRRKGDTQRESQDLLGQIKAESEETVKAFRQLHQFLDEQENSFLAQMDGTVKEIERVMEVHLEKLSKELQSLEGIIQEMEEKLQQSAFDLLQDIEKFLRSCQEPQSENSVVTPSALFKWRILDFHNNSSFLQGAMERFQETFISELSQQKGTPQVGFRGGDGGGGGGGDLILKIKSISKSGDAFYAVRKGRRVGVYRTWEECKEQVERYNCASFKKFAREEDAWSFINEGMAEPSHNSIGSLRTPYNVQEDNNHCNKTCAFSSGYRTPKRPNLQVLENQQERKRVRYTEMP